jgi:uncharacterized membrane protein YkoI
MLLGLAGLLLCPAAAAAQTGARRRQLRRERRQLRRENRRERRQERGDSDAVRDAVRRGEIHPLRELMTYFEQRTGARILDVEYRNRGGQHLYGFKVSTPAGRLRWEVINAATREIMTLDEARARYGN